VRNLNEKTMSTSTIYRRLARLRANLREVDSQLESIEPAMFMASVALTYGLTTRGNLMRQIWALEERLEQTRLSNREPIAI
jgi:hypothetical protein